ncbi:MAG TPA: integrase arm-type DNA-binding domain-containing protein [Methylobacter sp.]|jgi:hypothetical protein
MTKHLLNNATLKAIKPTDKDQLIGDGNGLFLLVKPDGKKWWRFVYTFQGKRKALSLGVYPKITLSAARKQAEANREYLANGINPSDLRKQNKLAKAQQDKVDAHAADGPTPLSCFKYVAEKWHSKRMKIGITSFQKNRNPWILEWLAFHMVVGFDSFHIYLHNCTDGMSETLFKLMRHYPLYVNTIGNNELPQLSSYQHSLNCYAPSVDWMAFIDGDEFLFPTQHQDIADALALYEKSDISALAVYSRYYGSSGHLKEPNGLIMENYPRHSSKDFAANKHVKSIVRGGLSAASAKVSVTSSLFCTQNGTFDEKHRPIFHPAMHDLEPSYDFFRINHYATQSYEYFKSVKEPMKTADATENASKLLIQSFHDYDRNECDDGLSYNFLVRLKMKVMELQEVIDNYELFLKI